MSTDAHPRRRGPGETRRTLCYGCGIAGLVAGGMMALATEFTTYARNSVAPLEGIFITLTLLTMGVLIPNPWIRAVTWLVVVSYAYLLLRALLLAGRG